MEQQLLKDWVHSVVWLLDPFTLEELAYLYFDATCKQIDPSLPSYYIQSILTYERSDGSVDRLLVYRDVLRGDTHLP